MYKSSNLKIIVISQVIKIQVFPQTYYYGVYANVQYNLCAKRSCGHQPCYHLVLITGTR